MVVMMMMIGGEGGGGGVEGKEGSSKGALERAGEGTAEEGRREEAEKSPSSHLREGDPFWRERAENWKAEEAGRGCRFARLLAREEAQPESYGRCHPEPRRRRDSGPRAGENAAAAQAVTSSLSPLGRRRQQPEPDSLTSRRERHTEREMIISCVESSGKDPEDSPPPHSQSRGSPLRSVDCTAAPEGQTKFGFGKRFHGAVLEILNGCNRSGKSCQPSPGPSRGPLIGPIRWAACAWPSPKK
ncbi:uncharacterized protein WM277_022658 [Molossus nigricans]